MGLGFSRITPYFVGGAESVGHDKKGGTLRIWRGAPYKLNCENIQTSNALQESYKSENSIWKKV
jgi:hypothetical protein